MGEARAGKPTKARRRKVAPAELARLLRDPKPLLQSGWTPKQIKDESKRLDRLHDRLYGRQAIDPPEEPPPPSDDPKKQPPPVGGCIGGICCSHAWADEAWHRELPYPPKVETRNSKLETGMRLCLTCGAFVPPIYLGSSGHCTDCRLEKMPDEQSHRLQASASVIDFYQLRRGTRRVP